jgi:adenosylmethionine-8-amino-7-oxononanoate aminotransferase
LRDELDKDELIRLDLEHVLHPDTDISEVQNDGPIIIVSGDGCVIRDIDGNEFLDGTAGLQVVNIGHGREEMAEAAAEQIGKLSYYQTFWGYSNPSSIKLAQKLAELCPEGLNRVFFSSGGSDATETAIKSVRLYNFIRGKREKHKIICRNSAYHGVHFGSLSATGFPFFREPFEPLVPGFLHIAAPYCYRCEFGLTYPECELKCAWELERVVKVEGAETVAAFMAEPVMGVAGVYVPPKEYYPIIREICDKYELLFIADEVLNGFGRTGRMFGHEHWDAKPDIIAMAKGMTSGYLPLGATVLHDDIYAVIKEYEGEFPHGYTFSGHPACCAVALKNIEIIERESLVARARETGEYLGKKAERLRELPLVGDVRGLGLLWAVEFVQDRETKEPFPRELRVGHAIMHDAWEKGLRIRAAGDRTLLAPPFVISTEQVDFMVDTLYSSIRAVADKMKLI